MVSNSDKWMRIFDVPEVSNHKKGFTLYKIISMLYPENCPDAVTKITVWKRYSEFKKLHKDLKGKYQKLHLKDRFPILPNIVYFNRFNTDIIEERRGSIMIFLNFVAEQPQLFTCNEFVKFFETSHTPNELINSTINSIRAQLHLPSEMEYLSPRCPDTDEEYTVSDTDSVCTINSLSSSVQIVDLLQDPLQRSINSLNRLSKRVSPDSSQILKTTSCGSSNTSSDETASIVNNCKYSLHDVTFKLSDSSAQYVVEAAQYVTEAMQMESEKEYERAFNAYKAGINVVLDDSDRDRRVTIKYKIEKYLLRAEKIYNLYLSPEMKAIQKQPKVEIHEVQKPLADLYKYKVLKIIDSGMLVIHSESQKLFYVKVLHKTSEFDENSLILPQSVPFMVQMHSYYNCENAVFLILSYCCSTKLCDYVKQKHQTEGTLRTTGVECEKSVVVTGNNNTEGSYVDLINEYVTGKHQQSHTEDEMDVESQVCNLRDSSSEDSCVDITSNDGGIDTKLPACDFTMKNDEDFFFVNMPNNMSHQLRHRLSERKLSSKSSVSEDEFPQYVIDMKDVIKWSAQLLLALEALHSLGVMCCNIQIKNLLIDEHGDLVLTYMCSLSSEVFFDEHFNMCPAPEYMWDKVTPAADWWNYGVILYELLVGVSLRCAHPEGVSDHIHLKIPRFVSAEGRSLLRQLLRYEPSERLGCGLNGSEDIKMHPFFSSIHWSKLTCK